jgi:MFS transporter, ACS family, D-galactonate transporter
MSAHSHAEPTVRTGDTVPSKRRFLIMGMLFVTVVINYLDRSNLSIAAPAIASEFGLHPVQLGLSIACIRECSTR